MAEVEYFADSGDKRHGDSHEVQGVVLPLLDEETRLSRKTLVTRLSIWRLSRRLESLLEWLERELAGEGRCYGSQWGGLGTARPALSSGAMCSPSRRLWS